MPDPQTPVAPPQSVTVSAPPLAQMDTQSSPTSGQIPQQDAPPPPAPTAQQANQAHASMIGHGFKALLSSMGGTTTQYQQTPDGPQPVQVKNSGGDFFRNILAGALTGAAAGGADHSGGFWGGASRGAGAENAGLQQQQQMRQKQAQQQFQNKQAADKASQESTAADTENTLRKAETQIYNLNKLKMLQDIHMGSYNDHTALVNNAKPIVSSYNASGLNPVREGVSETEHEQWIKDHPGDSSLDWQPVGVTNYVDKDNNVGYQTVWDAYDPQGKIKVAPAVIKDWTDSGLLGHRPDLAKALKPDVNGDVTLPYQGLIRLQQQSDSLKSMTKTKQDNDYSVKQQKATLEHLAAEAVSERASANASGSEAALRTYELSQQKAATAAQTNLAKKGWEGLSPTDKVALQPQVQKDINDIRDDLKDPLLKQQLTSNDPDVVKEAQARATDLHQRLDEAQRRSIFVPPSAAGSATDPRVAATVSALKGKTPEEVNAALSTAPIPESSKQAILAGLGIRPGPTEKPDDVVTAKMPDGTTQTMTREDFTAMTTNPARPEVKTAKIINAAPAAPAPDRSPQRRAESLSNLM